MKRRAECGLSLVAKKSNFEMREHKMIKKTALTIPLLALAMGAGYIHADQATLEAIQGAGVSLTAAQAAQISSAQGDALVAAIADLVAATTDPVQIEKIIKAAVTASPDLAAAIVAAAVKKAPGQAVVITAAAASVHVIKKPSMSTNTGSAPSPSNNNNASPT